MESPRGAKIRRLIADRFCKVPTTESRWDRCQRVTGHRSAFGFSRIKAHNSSVMDRYGFIESRRETSEIAHLLRNYSRPGTRSYGTLSTRGLCRVLFVLRLMFRGDVTCRHEISAFESFVRTRRAAPRRPGGAHGMLNSREKFKHSEVGHAETDREGSSPVFFFSSSSSGSAFSVRQVRKFSSRLAACRSAQEQVFFVISDEAAYDQYGKKKCRPPSSRRPLMTVWPAD